MGNHRPATLREDVEMCRGSRGRRARGFNASSGRAGYGRESAQNKKSARAPFRETRARLLCLALAAEQREDVLAGGVGDRQRLDAELLLNLQSLEAGRLGVHVGVDERRDTAIES